MLDQATEAEARRQRNNRRRPWKWLILAALGAAAFIVTLVLALASANHERDDALGLQESSADRIILAATLDATMARSEAALGRFVISGDRALGALYSDEWRTAGLLLDRLESASREDHDQSQRVAALRQAFDGRGHELASTALRTTYGQNSEALSIYYRIRTSPSLDRVNALVAAVIDHERGVLASRSLTADARIGQANQLAKIVSIVGLVLVTGAGFLSFRSLREAQKRVREEERSADLEDAVASRTAELSTANARLLEEMETRQIAEAQLRQAQKMDAVGQLTGGIAHDFNNMLAVVLGGVELAKRRIIDGAGDPLRHLDSAYEGAHRAAALTKRLLSFARAEPLLPAAITADDLITGMSELIDRTLGETISVVHVGRAERWPVFVDRHQLENALLNLAVNARDAMENGGTLTITTEQIIVNADDVADLRSGDYVQIKVSDTGTGIPADVLDRIFNPFFTTKAADKGTGLGLSQVFACIKQSGGTVTVESRLGEGTTVALYLPRHLGEATAGTAEPKTEPDVTSRFVRILVVEDDRRVLAATVEALREIGHDPIACLGSEDAAAMLRTNPDVALVLSDVLMPGMPGPELIKQLAREHPTLRAIYVTGFAGDIDSTAFDGHIVLRKPFTISALAAAIDSELRATAAVSVLETRAAA